MRIQHNIMAMNSYRNYNNNTSALSKNLEKLSSGYKINRAGDDAAGLAISEKMRGQITGLDAAQKNVKDGISLVKTAEGAMQEVQDMLKRMRYLATQSANGTYQNDVDRENIQREVDQLIEEIDRIGTNANFNGIYMLDGTYDGGKVTLGSGGGAGGGTTLNTGAPTASVDQANAAGVKEVTFSKDANVADEVIDAFNTAMGENGMTFKVETTSVASNSTLAAGDTLKVDFSDLIGKGYTVSYTDGAGSEANVATGEQSLTVGTSANNIPAGTAMAFKVKDKDGNDVGTINIDMSTTTTTPGATTVTMSAAASAAATPTADGGTGEAVKQKYSFDFSVATALVDGDEIQLDGTTILKVNDTGTATDGTEISSTDAGDAKKLGDAVAAALGKQSAYADWNVTFDDTNNKIVIEAKVAGEIKADNEAGGAPTAKLTAVPNLTVGGTGTGSLNLGGTLDEDAAGADGDGGAGGNGTGLTLQIGDSAGETITLSIGTISAQALGIKGLSVSDITNANQAIDKIRDATNYVSGVRGLLGAYQNRLEHTQNNLSVMAENIQDAESTIRDTDVADEMMSYVKNNILVQSAQAMLAQANQVPQGVLQLLG